MKTLTANLIPAAMLLLGLFLTVAGLVVRDWMLAGSGSSLCAVAFNCLEATTDDDEEE